MPAPAIPASLQPQTAEQVFSMDAVTTGTIRPWDWDRYSCLDDYLAYGHLTHEEAIQGLGDCIPAHPHTVLVRATWALITPHHETCCVSEFELADAADEDMWFLVCDCDVRERLEYVSLSDGLQHYAAVDAPADQPGALPVTWILVRDA